MPERLRLRLAALLAASAAAALAGTSGPRASPLRRIDPQARAGRLVITQFPRAVLDGREVLMAPGVRIRSPENLLRVPAGLVGEHLVRYRLDPGGQVIEIWLLTDDEAAEAARNPGTPR